MNEELSTLSAQQILQLTGVALDHPNAIVRRRAHTLLQLSKGIDPAPQHFRSPRVIQSWLEHFRDHESAGLANSFYTRFSWRHGPYYYDQLAVLATADPLDYGYTSDLGFTVEY